MRFHLTYLLVAFVAAGLCAAEPGPHRDRCVILISVDGLANFYFDDPRADMPTMRKLAREGARANGLVCSFPTVTWPNHTTLVTGTSPAKHGVLANNYLDRSKGTPVPLIPDPLFDKDEIVKSPTIYDVAHQAGLSTAAVIWPATRNANTLDWTVPDMFEADAWPKYGTRGWLEELRQAGLPIEKQNAWCKEQGGGVQRDWLYSRMAAHVLEHHSPHVLLVHLVEVDHVEHRYGPRTPEAYWSVSYADDRVRDIWEAAQRSRYQDKTTILIASDHGFFGVQKEIRPNVRLRQMGLLADGKKQAWCLSQGGACAVYLLDDARRNEISARLAKDLSQAEGVASVYSPEQFEQLGQATPATDPRAPDLWLAAKDGYSFVDSQEGEALVVTKATPNGTHGYLPDQPDMWGTLILSGYGIKSGSELGKVASIDVAPTMARLLGIAMPTAEGKPLVGALRE
jgi:predicted AlkP superfamily pyrophosphatase or phosphodiesterase